VSSTAPASIFLLFLCFGVALACFFDYFFLKKKLWVGGGV
jgi:hypothetical protein